MSPAPDETRRERVRRFLLERSAQGFRQSSKGWFVLRPKWLFHVPEATYAFEYAGCDAERTQFHGELLGAWLVDGTGVHPVDATPAAIPRERRGIWFRFSRLHFFISPDGDWVILASLTGPRAGHGGRYRVVPRGDAFEFAAEGPHWIA